MKESWRKHEVQVYIIKIPSERKHEVQVSERKLDGVKESVLYGKGQLSLYRPKRAPHFK